MRIILFTRISLRPVRFVSDPEVSRCFCVITWSVNDELHAVQTKNVDNCVHHCAHSLLDERLIAKLSTGDMVAIEAKYHARCLAGLYNKTQDGNQ